MSLVRLLSTLLLLVFVIPACRCTSGEQQIEPDDNDETTDESGESESGDNWTAGILPEEVNEGEPRQGGEVTVQLYSEPATFNTHVTNDAWGTWMTHQNIYESLIRRDPYDDPEYGFRPELAERWDVSDDGLEYTFHLRQGVKWHDGEDFNAEDVIATYDKIMDESVRAVHRRSYLEELESYEQIDEYTVKFTWNNPYFLAMDVMWSFPIQPAHVIADLSGAEYNESATNPLNRHPMGTGPFKWVEWESNTKIVMERFDDYWGDNAHLDRIIFRLVPEAPIGLQLASRGELDVVTRLTAEMWANMDEPSLRENYHRVKYFGSNYAWIGWNQARPFFQDARVRRAMTMLTDREGVRENLMHGLYKESHCHFYWASEQCNFEYEQIDFDPVAATELLEEAGWTDTNDNGIRDKDGVEFEFTFMIPASSTDAGRIATKMKEDFERAGITINIQRVEWSAYTGRLKEREFDACTLLWSSSSPYGDPAQIWSSESIEGGGSNYIGYQNERVDEIIRSARTNLNDAERTELYKEFGQILWDEQPYTWLYTRPRLSLVKTNLRGIREGMMYWQFRDWWLAEAE